MMTIREVLSGSLVESIDAEILIGHVLGKSRSWILAHDDERVSSAQKQRIDALLARRKSGEPIAYITGMKEFYGRDFLVTPDVLIPRPATESIVRLALEFLKGDTPKTQEIDTGISAYVERLSSGEIDTVIDVGTGNGCIAITLALEGVKQEILGVDICEKALAIAIKNQSHFDAAEIEWMLADGQSFIHGFRKPFLLVSNPPYIPRGTLLEASVVEFEPHQALFAGDDGMEVIQPMMKAARENPMCIGMVIEMRSDQ